MQLFLSRGYEDMLPLRSVGVSVSSLVSDTTPLRMDLFGSAAQRDKHMTVARCVDEIRSRFGTQIINRGSITYNPVFRQINPIDDHTIHPVPFYTGK